MYKSIFFFKYIITKLKCTLWRWNLNRSLEFEYSFAHIFPFTSSHKFMLYYCQPNNSACILQVFDDLFTSVSLIIRIVISVHLKTSNFSGTPAGLKL